MLEKAAASRPSDEGLTIEQIPTNSKVLAARERAQTASGDTEGAIATYKRIYELSPGSISALAGYVAQLKESKEFSTERTVLQSALARDPKNNAVKGGLIRVDAAIGGMRAGLAKAHAFAGGDPENPLFIRDTSNPLAAECSTPCRAACCGSSLRTTW